MRNILGRPLGEALSSLSPDEAPPRVVETAAPRRDGQTRREGTLRVVACREGVWIAARFLDSIPERKDEA
ncbi:MAG: hypothetical protein IKP72_14315 [Clostridia bacterium]|jgi:hypothetical protein|nr:hypothetical protein [Clostridia bacterium]